MAKSPIIVRLREFSRLPSKIEKMIDDERYCLDIIGQSLAIQKSLASINKVLLENHVRTHLRHQLSSENEADVERAVQEMVKLYELNLKNGNASNNEVE